MASNDDCRIPGAPRSRRRYAPAIALVLLAGGLIGPAAAGIISVPEALGNFIYEDGRIDYSPSLADQTVVVTAENRVRLAPRDSRDHGAAAAAIAGLPAQLDLRADVAGRKLLSGHFNIFGSLTPAADIEPTELTARTLRAMEANDDTAMFDFLLADKKVSGGLARRYWNIGLFVPVAGISDEDLAELFGRPGSLMNLQLRAEDGGPSAPVNTNPAPATVWLLLAALPLLALRRHLRLDRR